MIGTLLDIKSQSIDKEHHSLPLAIITFVAIREKKTDMIGTLLLT